MEQIPIAADDFHSDEKDYKEQVFMMDQDSDSEKTESDSDADTADSKQVNDKYRVLTSFETMSTVDEASEEYKTVVTGFKTGMGSAAGVTEVVALHRHLFPAEFHGESPVRYCCYYGSTDEIARVIVQGFGSLSGDESGRIELFPVKFALDGAKQANAGDDGLRRMLLCRVVLGKTEEEKELPRCSDCVVNVNTRRFYVSTSCESSCVTPAYVVSFRAPASLEGYYARTNIDVIGNRVPVNNICIATLVDALKRFLMPREMKEVLRLLEDFRARKIDAAELRRKANLVAGDKWISAVTLLRVMNPSVRDICVAGLITVLAEVLPVDKIEMLRKSYGKFSEKKISRPQLARSVRDIVGNDTVLIQAINSYKIRKQQRPQDKQSFVRK